MFKVNVKEQVEKKNDLITRAEEIVNGAETEQRELTSDEAQELAEIRDDVKAIKAKLEAVKELEDETEVIEEKETTDMNENACKEEAEARAFENYVRGVVSTRTDDVDMTKLANGAVIPQTIANKIIAKDESYESYNNGSNGCCWNGVDIRADRQRYRGCCSLSKGFGKSCKYSRASFN